MKIVAYIESEVRDKDGKLLHHEKKEANSLVRAFIDLLYVQMAQLTLVSMKQTSGAAANIPVGSANLSAVAAANDATNGIVVGTGTAAVTVTDYALQTKINNGSGAGQLNHLVTTFTTPATVGSTHSFTISRGFTNLSGNSISVSEVGLYVIGYSGGNYYFCADRTLMSFSIANGATGTVTYTIQISV